MSTTPGGIPLHTYPPGTRFVTLKVGGLSSNARQWHLLLTLLTLGFWGFVWAVHEVVRAASATRVTLAVPPGHRVEWRRGEPYVAPVPPARERRR